MFLTVAIPTYNGAETLERVLNRFIVAIEKVGGGVELLVSDNCSDDGTEAICRQFEFKYPKIFRYFRSERNYGYSYNVDKCVRHSRGKWVWLFSDNEILISTRALIKIELFLRNYDCQFLLMNSSNEIHLNSDKIYFADSDEFFQTTKFKGGLISACVVQRKLWEELEMDRYIGSPWIQFAYQIEALSPIREHHNAGVIYEVMYSSIPVKSRWGHKGTFLLTGLDAVELFQSLPKLGYDIQTKRIADYVIKGGYPMNIIKARGAGLIITDEIYERMSACYGEYKSFRTVDTFFLKYCPKFICFIIYFICRVSGWSLRKVRKLFKP